MKGFLKRDFYLMETNLKFYLLFIGAFALLAMFTDFSVSFLSLYVVIFAMSGIAGLFSYDDMSRWTAYGAAAPTGRRAMVDARYLLTLLIAAGITLIQGLLGLLNREPGAVPMTAVYSGLFLLYAALALPVNYRFGGTRSRTVMIVLMAVLAGAVGLGGSMLNMSAIHGEVRLPPMTLVLPLLGLGALWLSRQAALAVMAKKEL